MTPLRRRILGFLVAGANTAQAIANGLNRRVTYRELKNLETRGYVEELERESGSGELARFTLTAEGRDALARETGTATTTPT